MQQYTAFWLCLSVFVNRSKSCFTYVFIRFEQQQLAITKIPAFMQLFRVFLLKFE